MWIKTHQDLIAIAQSLGRVFFLDIFNPKYIRVHSTREAWTGELKHDGQRETYTEIFLCICLDSKAFLLGSSSHIPTPLHNSLISTPGKSPSAIARH